MTNKEHKSLLVEEPQRGTSYNIRQIQKTKQSRHRCDISESNKNKQKQEAQQFVCLCKK